MKFDLSCSKIVSYKGDSHGMSHECPIPVFTVFMTPITWKTSSVVNTMYWCWFGIWKWPVMVNFEGFTIWAGSPASILPCPYLSNYLAKFHHSKHQGSLEYLFDEIEVRYVDQSSQNMSVQKWTRKGDVLTENEACPYYWSTLCHTFLLCQWLVCI